MYPFFNYLNTLLYVCKLCNKCTDNIRTLRTNKTAMDVKQLVISDINLSVFCLVSETVG
jgi:glutaredoxin-related protein